ncbi:tRNA modification GTPase [Halobacteriovorax sp. HLS]|uniref:tRNA modification GTPase n=1 Tax=Halobacteriovorax sp. HLS TaxID=2234000 RepID=UPI000FD94E34|nr:GTPase [Halobacteriovorax sp. HLS]
MYNLYDDKPIIACSTGMVSNSAIGLIRISGFDNLISLQEFFSFDLKKVKARYNHFSKLLFNSCVLDEVVFSYYPGPNSYNGENILEISVHGNQLNISKIISVFIDNTNIRAAREGEFSYRALKNGKLSLSQVEGLDLLLNASSSYMLEQGLDILQGDLYLKYKDLHSSFLKVKSSIEIGIDFSEDVGEETCATLLNEALDEFSVIINQLHSRISSNLSELSSPSVSLVGKTNAGKSSLFNLLLNSDRSIVSDIEGTTRDYVSEYINMHGNNFRVIDTAGLRSTTDSIEQIGIKKALDIHSSSFFKILVINPLDNIQESLNILGDNNFDLVIFSHADKKLDIDFSLYEEILQSAEYSINTCLSSDNRDYILIGPMGADSKFGSIEPVNKVGPMGAISKFGPIEPVGNGPIEPLSRYISSLIVDKFTKLTADKPLLIDRHRQKVNEIYLSFKDFQDISINNTDIAILSSEINILGSKVSELVGIISPDDVLNNIFSNFCIGK